MGTVRSLPLLLLSLLFSSQVSAQQTLSGTVIDSSGSALPRVAVHLVDAQGAEVAATFTDARGAFTFARACAGCTATITLPGVNPARESISAETPATIRLTVAPISEAVVVTATRTEIPPGDPGADVTVISSEDSARRDVP